MKKLMMFILVTFFNIQPAYAFSFSLFGDSNIELVKEGVIHLDESITVKDALEGYKFFNNSQWKSFESDQGRIIVEFLADIDYKNMVKESLEIDTSNSFFIKDDKIFYDWLVHTCDEIIKFRIQFIINKNKKDFQVGAIKFDINGNLQDVSSHSPLKSIWMNKPIFYFWKPLFFEKYKTEKSLSILENLVNADRDTSCLINDYINSPFHSLVLVNKIDKFSIELNLFLIEKEKWENGRTEVYSIKGDYIKHIYPFNSKDNIIRIDYKGDFGKILLLYDVERNIVTDMEIYPITFPQREWMSIGDRDTIALRRKGYKIIGDDTLKIENSYTVSLLSLYQRADNIYHEKVNDSSSNNNEVNNIKMLLTMKDENYEKFTENDEFCLSQSILQETLRYIKLSLTKSKYLEVLKEHEEWLAHGRDTAANQYAITMPDVSAYTKANFERADELAKIINSQVIPGEYIYIY